MSKKKTNNLWIIIVGIIVVALAGYFAYTYFSGSSTEKVRFRTSDLCYSCSDIMIGYTDTKGDKLLKYGKTGEFKASYGTCDEYIQLYGLNLIYIMDIIGTVIDPNENQQPTRTRLFYSSVDSNKLAICSDGFEVASNDIFLYLMYYGKGVIVANDISTSPKPINPELEMLWE